MKKITLMVALLGSFYFSNAQVGIGTPAPANSSQLDIVANNKGVLIPRVALTSTADFAPISGTEVESLLVYNTATAGDVTPGFYYWFNNKWERIVNQTQLNEVIKSQADIAKIKELLDAAYGSNNLGDTATTGSFGGMVFTPAVGSTAAKFEYVKWNATSNSYERLDITSVITDLINASETKTKIVTIDKKQYYVSESYAGAANPIDITDPGVYKIDVVGGVVNNIEEIFTTTTNIVINEGETNEQTFTTVQEYIEYISQNSKQDGETKIVYDVDGNVVFQTWDSATNAWVDVDNVKFSKIVKDNETKTTLARSVNAGDYTPITADPKAATKVTYEYSAEGGVKNYIDVTADIVTSITNNTDVQNAISNVLNQGGNVYYGDVNGTNVFYTIVNGVKTPVEISQVVVNAITNATTIQKQEIKNQLGDTYSTTTVVNTGDTWIDGGKIYKGIYETNVLGGTANITGASASTAGSILITAPSNTTLGDVISIKILNKVTNSLITESVTDVKLENGNLYFRIGTGTMYNVLSATDLGVNVLVEFSAITTP